MSDCSELMCIKINLHDHFSVYTPSVNFQLNLLSGFGDKIYGQKSLPFHNAFILNTSYKTGFGKN